ncbi:MAG: DUF4177 domain-containing protein [Gemmobacter sp.]
MQRYEYKAIPAPRKGEKSKDARTTPDRFALALTQVMNAMGRDGWEYLRADTLPCEERVGLTGRQTTFQNVLVFRRALGADVAPATAPTPVVHAPAPEAQPAAAASVSLPEPDPMDDAARRTGVIPTLARPAFGAAPKLVAPAAPAAPERRAPLLSAMRAVKPDNAGG